TDKLNAVRFDASEGLSELFDFRIEAIAEDPVKLDSIIGEGCTVTVLNKQGKKRNFHGIAVEANWLGEQSNGQSYEVVLKPGFWLLTRTSDCRIFHDKTAVDIIKEVLGECNAITLTDKLSESYATREYCVQFNETDYSFVCRLMEEEGMYYYFEHEQGSHKMVLADAKSSHSKVKDLDSLVYATRFLSSNTEQDCLFNVTLLRSLQTGKYALNDYKYLKPNASMLAEEESSGKYANGTLEQYFYPGKYVEKSDGERLAKVRVEEEQAQDERRQATGDSPLIYPGGLATLSKHPQSGENQEYLVIQARHSYEGGSYASGGAQSGGDAPYRGVYEMAPADRPFRAPSITPRPKVLGPQTARVVGKQGEEIDVDEHGRILVHFFWDRKKAYSRRVRVAQTWADKTFGAVWIPRIGQEVVVEYLDGEPDLPLVTGCVYNGENTLPLDLPGDKNISGLKTNSTKGGGGSNEFWFDDTKSKELINMHAEKDLEVFVENTEKRTIGDEFKTKKGKFSRETTLLNGDEDVILKEGDNNVTIDKGDQTFSIKKGDQAFKINAGSQKTTAGKDVKIDAGSNVTITAGTNITLKVGGSSIEITNSGVKIKGTATIDANAGAKMTLKGGIININ
ncbi:MAG: type VI secretion system tip protein TssI/VgrG, partial [Myxococcota bacterium]